MGSSGDVLDRCVHFVSVAALQTNSTLAIPAMASVKYFSPTTNLCIIRVARDNHRMAWGAITLLTAIDDVRVIPHVVHVSGGLWICQRDL